MGRVEHAFIENILAPYCRADNLLDAYVMSAKEIVNVELRFAVVVVIARSFGLRNGICHSLKHGFLGRYYNIGDFEYFALAVRTCFGVVAFFGNRKGW